MVNPKGMTYTPLDLRKENDAKVSFTDAILDQDEIYFSAAAEDTQSTYHDGEILGSYIGNLNANTLALNYIKKISSHQKIEGITFYRKQGEQIELLLCEDRDTATLTTVVYKISL